MDTIAKPKRDPITMSCEDSTLQRAIANIPKMVPGVRDCTTCYYRNEDVTQPPCETCCTMASILPEWRARTGVLAQPDVLKALTLGRAHAQWSVDRSNDVTERRMNEHDVKRIDAAIAHVSGVSVAGEWRCASCGNRCFADEAACPHCKAPRPSGVSAADGETKTG